MRAFPGIPLASSVFVAGMVPVTCGEKDSLTFAGYGLALVMLVVAAAVVVALVLVLLMLLLLLLQFARKQKWGASKKRLAQPS